MEKRTILAFFLSFLVLIVWSFFFGPRQDQTPKKEGKADIKPPIDISEILPAPDIGQSRPSQAPIQLETPKVDEKEIEVDTPLYHAVLSNVGPTIKSFKLKKYYQSLESDPPLIELINLKNEMDDFLRINFADPNSAGEEKNNYQVDCENIHLDPGASPKGMVFRLSLSNGLSVDQTFRFYPDQYCIDISVDLVNRSAEPVNGSCIVDLKALPPSQKASYYSYVGLVLLLNDELEEAKIKEESEGIAFNGNISWVGYEDDYFLSAVIPEKGVKGAFRGTLLPSGVLNGTYIPPSISVPPSQQTTFHYALYLGPRDLGILKQHGNNLDRAVDFGWTDIIAKPLLYILRFFNNYINNYGISIILLTILVKILFWPLTHKSYKSMKEMQKLQPRMAKIREKYQNNKQQMNVEMMALYKTYKVNPLSGCLPMIVQIPVFFALFRILGSAIELRHEPFMLWVTDLSAPDRLFSFPFTVPFMEPPYGIPVLTLLMGASMFIQQKMTPTPGDPAQAKIMMFLPIIFTFMFINFPSGLVLYWLVNNILSIGQQYRILKSSA